MATMANGRVSPGLLSMKMKYTTNYVVCCTCVYSNFRYIFPLILTHLFLSYFQVKLSGRGDKPVVNWAGKGILATATGEAMIR